MENKIIANKNKALLTEATNFIKSLDNNFKEILNGDYYTNFTEVAKQYKTKLDYKEVLVNMAAVAYFSRVLDTYYPTKNERDTMSYIAKENLAGCDEKTTKTVLNVRQLIYTEYRKLRGIIPGLEYDKTELVKECAPEISIPLIAACEIINNKNFSSVGVPSTSINFTSKEKLIANGIVNKKSSIISVGEQYRSEMGKLGVMADRLLVKPEMNKK